MGRLKQILLIESTLIANLLAWYPDYSVMATDFVVPRSFLAPARIQSIGLQSLGPDFFRIYRNPVDDSFQNPAYLKQVSGSYLYLEISGDSENETSVDNNDGVYRDYYMTDMYPYYWSPYQYTEEPAVDEPIASLIYLGQPLKWLPLRVGGAFEYYFDRQPFYQPYWYGWGWRNMDAVGATYETNLVDPYDDYRVVEAGDNLQDEKGYRINSFAALPVLGRLVLGARLTLLEKSVDGIYTDLNFNDDSQWADEYLSFNSDERRRDQNLSQQDLALGVLLNLGEATRFGVTVGYINGDIERELIESDTSRYYSRYFWQADTTHGQYYNSSSAYSSAKNWQYDGATQYGEAHGDIGVNEDVTLRFSAYYEKRLADLVESESMWRHSSHFSHYWNYYDTTDYDYENNSHASLERSGTGEYSFDNLRLSFGADWRLAPEIRFIGGVVFDRKNDRKTADEPFQGAKYSYYGNNWYEYYSNEYTQIDDKRFNWWRKEAYATISVPTGVIVNIGDNLELSVGLTKVIKTTDIDEGYDLIVYHDEEIRQIDGMIIASTDSAYVDGHSFPGTHLFSDEYQMNAGVAFKYHDNFKITAALKESILEPRSFKIGAEFHW
ncbi:MAG: hypothetical protein ABIA75_10215 [Candidatus Neomarinimicrobiota bacterium]